LPHHGPTAWQGSTRRATLPADWPQRVIVVKNRAYGRCEWPGWLPGRYRRHAGAPCRQLGTDCDHIDDRDNHDLSNLQLLCRGHHVRKSLADQRTRRVSEKRPRERHPGYGGSDGTNTEAQRSARSA
jgi:5-methylcytosine-specific restriction protein A